jgi:hypothetical protein
MQKAAMMVFKNYHSPFKICAVDLFTDEYSLFNIITLYGMAFNTHAWQRRWSI